MEKIASPNELVSELQKIISAAQQEKPSRRKLSKELRDLSNRVAFIDPSALRKIDDMDRLVSTTIDRTVSDIIRIDDPVRRYQTYEVFADILHGIAKECEEAIRNVERQQKLER